MIIRTACWDGVGVCRHSNFIFLPRVLAGCSVSPCVATEAVALNLNTTVVT